MKAHLLFRDRDFDWRWALEGAAIREAARSGRRYQVQNFDWNAGLPWNTDALTVDLGLDTVFNAMSQGDDGIFVVARKVILSAVASDLGTIQYRHGILKEAIERPGVVRELYDIAVGANEKRQASYLGLLSRFPDSVLRDGLETMLTLFDFLKRLRAVADDHGPKFTSEGWAAFFAMIRANLDEDFFAALESHLGELRFRNGELISAALGKANKGRRHLLHHTRYRPWNLWDWWAGVFSPKAPVYSFDLPPRDEAGSQALQALRNRGIALAARSVGQAADHVRDFFGMLRAELAFYVGCINLHERLARKGEPTCMPTADAASERLLFFTDLYDIALALTMERRVVGNDTNADGRRLVVITGPNTGGKSTYLRSVGLGQLMTQAGMFVPATSFRGSLCDGLFTHFKREEDAAMKSGKFDEELKRMSEIIDHIACGSMILFNESFAATNEREGSEIARQVTSALLEYGVRALCVTHLYELAHGFHARNDGSALFLRAARQVDGRRTFKITEGEPLPTSFGEDIYRSIFEIDGGRPLPQEAPLPTRIAGMD